MFDMIGRYLTLKTYASDSMESEEEHSDRHMVSAILTWYRTGGSKSFNPSFVEKMNDLLKDGKDLTEKQSDAVKNIYLKFNVEKSNSGPRTSFSKYG
jgi:hypothetical protein